MKYPETRLPGRVVRGDLAYVFIPVDYARLVRPFNLAYVSEGVSPADCERPGEPCVVVHLDSASRRTFREAIKELDFYDREHWTR